MNEVLKRIYGLGVIPVVVIDNATHAIPLAEALCSGGLHCAEITFRTEAAEDAIRSMSQKFPQMLIGAGTVLTTEQVQRAVDAGAKFIVSPGLNPKVVKYCIEKNIVIIPGVCTPSEIEKALELGIKVVKFFPAEALGGIKMIKAVAAPYPNVLFAPTGGIDATNMEKYLSYSKVFACGGSWMVKKDLIEEEAFDKIEQLTREAVDIVKKMRGR